MIFLSAQPNELYFEWQTKVQVYNFLEVGIDLSKVYCLVSNTGRTKDGWLEIAKLGINVLFYDDTRYNEHFNPNHKYISSIRPHIIAKFYKENPSLENIYTFYHDGDIIFRELPDFEGMMDGRWHVSETTYINWEYINNMNVPQLMNDMLSSVGIPEEMIKNNLHKTGGAQYLLKGVGANFWEKVERDCHTMHLKYYDNLDLYTKVWADNNTTTGKLATVDIAYKDINNNIEVKKKEIFHNDYNFVNWVNGSGVKPPTTKYDFQIWCVDMWSLLWNAWLLGFETYANPILEFSWPKDDISKWERCYIFHNSGIVDEDRSDFLLKQDYKDKTPFEVDLSNMGYINFDNGIKESRVQRKYIELIERIKSNTTVPVVTNSPKVSCLMTTYGRFTFVERSIYLWLLQDYSNKELIILNTADKPLVLSNDLLGKGIKIINNDIYSKSNTPYTNVGQIREDVINYASGEFYICWDDDDIFMPWHISQGMNYIQQNDLEAWMPEQSIWTPNGGDTFEYAKNALEASCIVKLSDIKRLGFNDSNGGEHLSWRMGLVSEGKLSENTSVYPLESYVYMWGEELGMGGHKQSSSIDDPNNFENHKALSTDFGDRRLYVYDNIPVSKLFNKIASFVNNEIFTNKLKDYGFHSV